eukprot:scaffold149_cov315-Pinguiococcus_pyrenoidosus.AAC.78
MLRGKLCLRQNHDALLARSGIADVHNPYVACFGALRSGKVQADAFPRVGANTGVVEEAEVLLALHAAEAMLGKQGAERHLVEPAVMEIEEVRLAAKHHSLDLPPMRAGEACEIDWA